MPAAPHGTGAKPARWPARVAGGLLALAVWVAQGLQPVAAQPADAHAALLATPLVPPATQWFHLADALAQARVQPGDEDRATLLRHRLLAAHIAALNGSPSLTPTPTVATLIAQAAPLPQADAALIDAWQRAFNRHVQLRLADAQRGPPFELAYLGRQLMPLGPGAWTMDASGRARYFWVLHLVNRSPTALPLPAFRLQADGLLLDCTPPAALPPGQPAPPGDALTDPGELVAPVPSALRLPARRPGSASSCAPGWRPRPRRCNCCREPGSRPAWTASCRAGPGPELRRSAPPASRRTAGRSPPRARAGPSRRATARRWDRAQPAGAGAAGRPGRDGHLCLGRPARRSDGRPHGPRAACCGRDHGPGPAAGAALDATTAGQCGRRTGRARHPRDARIHRPERHSFGPARHAASQRAGGSGATNRTGAQVARPDRRAGAIRRGPAGLAWAYRAAL